MLHLKVAEALTSSQYLSYKMSRHPSIFYTTWLLDNKLDWSSEYFHDNLLQSREDKDTLSVFLIVVNEIIASLMFGDARRVSSITFLETDRTISWIISVSFSEVTCWVSHIQIGTKREISDLKLSDSERVRSVKISDINLILH